jgi:pyridoxamine 5'-phosphate oxidase family protein
MSVFTPDELEYLGAGRQAGRGGNLARIATMMEDGTPHVVPVGIWAHNGDEDTIDVRGRDLDKTAKFRNVARTGRAAIVIDDLVELEPAEREAAGGWDSRPRAIEIRGRAEAIADAEPLIRIYPERIISWGTDPAQPTQHRARSVR